MQTTWTRTAAWCASLALLGCAGASVPMPQQSASPLASPSTVPARPSPLTDPREALYYTVMKPNVPCLGQAVTLTGMNYGSARRATIWLKGDTPEQATMTGSYAIDHVPYAVKVADVPIGAEGGFTTSFSLQARMAPVSTGGYLDLHPGQYLTLVIIDDAPGGGSRGLGFQLGREADCGGSQAPAEAPTLALDPAFPCFGDIVTLSGAGFEAEAATVEFKWEMTRFGDGPTATVSVPIVDGRFSHPFRLEDIKDAVGEPLFREGARCLIRAFDRVKNRYASVPVPVCNQALGRALTAPSIDVPVGITGDVKLPEGAVSLKGSAVLRSQAEWKDFAARHQLNADVQTALPGVDFAKDQLLVVIQPEGAHDQWLEIVAVESASEGIKVHSVAWEVPSPLSDGGALFYWQPVPRSDRPVVFLETAAGYSTQRLGLKPGLAARSPQRLIAGRDGQVALEPPIDFGP